MCKRFLFIGALMLVVCLAAYSQVTVVDEGEDGPKFSLTGSLTGMFSLGLMDDANLVNMTEAERASPNPMNTPGVYYGEETGKTGAGKNGYSTSMNFSMVFSPVSYTELFVKFLAQYRPGSPYIPLQLEDSDAKTFSNFSIDSAYGRVEAIKGLGFDLPLTVWLKGGKYDVTPSQYQTVSRFGTESVLNSLRTTNTYNMSLDAAYSLPQSGVVGLGLATHVKLKEAIPVLLDEDGVVAGTTVYHGDAKTTSDIPLHVALKLSDLDLSFGKLSAEVIYAYNAMNIYSGNNVGVDLGFELPIMDGLTVPLGLGAALYGKNIDPFANTSITDFSNPTFYSSNGYHYDSTLGKNWDGTTTSYRSAIRIGVGAGARYELDDIAANFNLGFAFSQIAHEYRDTLTLPSLSADVEVSYQKRYFIGGGVFLGTLTEAVWETKAGANDAETAALLAVDGNGFSHTFTLAENMGFEVYGGIRMGKAKFVLGYNINKGLSMNNSIESSPDGQIKYLQKDSAPSEGLFERGGVFAKLGISW